MADNLPIKRLYQKEDGKPFYPEVLGNSIGGIPEDSSSGNEVDLTVALGGKVGYLISSLEDNNYYIYGFGSAREAFIWKNLWNKTDAEIAQAGWSRETLNELVMFKIKTGEKSQSGQQDGGSTIDPNNPYSDPIPDDSDLTVKLPDLILPTDNSYGGGGTHFITGERVPLMLTNANMVKEIKFWFNSSPSLDITKYLIQISSDNGKTWEDLDQHSWISVYEDTNGNLVNYAEASSHINDFIKWEIPENKGYNWEATCTNLRDSLLRGENPYVLFRFNPSEAAEKIWEYHLNNGFCSLHYVNVKLYYDITLKNGHYIKPTNKAFTVVGTKKTYISDSTEPIWSIRTIDEHEKVRPYALTQDQIKATINSTTNPVYSMHFKWCNAHSNGIYDHPTVGSYTTRVTFEYMTKADLVGKFYYYLEDIGLPYTQQEKRERHIGVENKGVVPATTDLVNRPSEYVYFTDEELNHGIHLYITCGTKDDTGKMVYPTTDGTLVYNIWNYTGTNSAEGQNMWVTYNYTNTTSVLGTKVDNDALNPNRTLLYSPDYSTGEYNAIPILAYTGTLEIVNFWVNYYQTNYGELPLEVLVNSQDDVIRERTFYLKGSGLEGPVKIEYIDSSEKSWMKYEYWSNSQWNKFDGYAVQELINTNGKVKIKATCSFDGRQSLEYGTGARTMFTSKGVLNPAYIDIEYTAFGKEYPNIEDYGIIIDESDSNNPFIEALYRNAQNLGITTTKESGIFFNGELSKVASLPSGFMEGVKKNPDGLSNFTTLNLAEGTLSQLLPNLREIKDNAFRGCSNLTTVKLPSNVITIGSKAFSECNDSLTIQRRVGDGYRDMVIDDTTNQYIVNTINQINNE